MKWLKDKFCSKFFYEKYWNCHRILTNSARIGRNTVAVAVLLVHCVIADTTTQHIRLARNGDNAWRGCSFIPINADNPDSYNIKKYNLLGKKNIFQQRLTLAPRAIANPPPSKRITFHAIFFCTIDHVSRGGTGPVFLSSA